MMTRAGLGIAFISLIVSPALAAPVVHGGDTCETAPVIDSLPFHAISIVCGASHQYSAPCSGSESGPDVVYAYSPKANGFISIGVCESAIQPRLYVFADDCSSPDAVVACGQLTCTTSTGQARPRIESMQVLAGHTYYIVIDQASPLPCNQYFEIDVSGVQCLPCPPDAIEENEPNCGLDAEGQPADFVNGGCASLIPQFTAIHGDQSVCGTVASYGGTNTRDTDWFELITQTPARITWVISAEAALVLGVPDNGGQDDCSRVQCLEHVLTAFPCISLAVAVNRPAGRQWLFVAPQPGSDLACTTRYVLHAFVDPITADFNDDHVVDSLDLGYLLSAWTIPPGAPACAPDQVCPGDLNLDGVVDTLDLGLLLATWGPH